MKGDGMNYWTRILKDLEQRPEPMDLPAEERWVEDEIREMDDKNAIIAYLNNIPDDERNGRVDNIIGQLKFLIQKVEEAERKRLLELMDKYQRMITAGVQVQPPEKKQFFSADEAIKIAGKSKNTIYSHLSSGKLKADKDATGAWVISRAALEEYTKRTDF